MRVQHHPIETPDVAIIGALASPLLDGKSQINLMAPGRMVLAVQGQICFGNRTGIEQGADALLRDLMGVYWAVDFTIDVDNGDMPALGAQFASYRLR